MTSGSLDDLAAAVCRHHRQGIPEGWAFFMQRCASAVAPRLPAEARPWPIAAWSHHCGELSVEDLTPIRIAAIRYRNERKRGIIARADDAALQVAMSGLWPNDPEEDWSVTFEDLIVVCQDAGVSTATLEQIIRDSFPEAIAP